VIQPELPTDPIERVEIEALFYKGTQVIARRELQDERVAARLGYMNCESQSPHNFFSLAVSLKNWRS